MSSGGTALKQTLFDILSMGHLNQHKGSVPCRCFKNPQILTHPGWISHKVNHGITVLKMSSGVLQPEE